MTDLNYKLINQIYWHSLSYFYLDHALGDRKPEGDEVDRSCEKNKKLVKCEKSELHFADGLARVSLTNFGFFSRSASLYYGSVWSYLLKLLK